MMSLVTVFCFSCGLMIGMPLTLVFDRGRSGRFMHAITILWAKMILWSCPLWRLKVEGKRYLARGANYLVIANHQSMLDILIVLAGLPLNFKFLAKEVLYSVPFIGWHMALAGYMKVDRSSHESGRKAILEAPRWLKKGVSVLLFPEGTRSVDGKIHAFKMGAFKIASAGNAKILPVVLDGTGDALPKRSWRVERITQFRLSVGKPITIKDDGHGLEKTKDAIREEMIARLSRMRSETL
ncbi:MAG: lysophospholipid acyltransferase family protein [Candidatus Omnitrophica bacterium]|nr:lysophospholipid acyltransferase family protein [Candidatus Omnitrophota bacterium]MDD5670831.1 lysophospholipid acyltransferase family protein [Candidatus Omnitrophota bacterium]